MNATQNSSSHQQTLNLLEKVSSLYSDRHSELQLLWQDTGEDKWQKLQELSQMVSKAVDEIYKKVLDKSRKQNLDIKERGNKIEARLKEHLGPRALQITAPMELSLLDQLKMNVGSLKDLYHAEIDTHAHTEQSLVLTRLCNQVSSLNEMLNLPPCINAGLCEVLNNATEALHMFYSENSALNQVNSEHHSDNSLLYQLLYPLYRTLRSVEADLLFMKTTRKVFEILYCSKISTGPNSQDSREMVARKRSFDDKSALTTSTCNASEESLTEPLVPRPHITGKGSSLLRPLSDDSSALEKLGHKILKKLERIIKHLKYEIEQEADRTRPVCLLSSQLACAPTVSPFSNKIEAGIQAFRSSPKRSCSPLCIIESSPSTLQVSNAVQDSHKGCEVLKIQDQSNPRNACQALEYGINLANTVSVQQDGSIIPRHTITSVFTSPSLPTATKADKDMPTLSCTAIKRVPLIPITNNQTAPALNTGKSSSHLLYPPPPPPPPPLRQHPQRTAAILLPPPPPPLPSTSISGKPKAQAIKSTKLKKSATISRLYMGMKKKAEGVTSVQSFAVTDAAVQRRPIVGIGTREGMAEALAEITKRSAYFRKIEDDVNKQASSILFVKSQLESYESRDMNELLKFHRSIEVHLEQLTDESQVLARFDGFPVRKLETLRAAASLHLRLTFLMEQTENWVVKPPLLDHLDKFVAFFDKVKSDVEAIERTKDEDLKRFTSHKIQFSFETLHLIKEAVVRLSSRCLALALKESQRTKMSATSGDEAAYTSTKDMKKQKVSFQTLYRTFQLAYRVHNFAGGHDEMAERLCSELGCEMETYPSTFWFELVQ